VTISTLINRTCTITRRSSSTSKDDYGNVIPATSTVTTVCELQQQPRRSDSESEAHADLSDTQWVAFLLPGEQIDASDKITVDGQAFEVAGQPWPARNPRTQAVSHIEVNLRRVAGGADS
jgi:hypothetical protein